VPAECAKLPDGVVKPLRPRRLLGTRQLRPRLRRTPPLHHPLIEKRDHPLVLFLERREIFIERTRLRLPPRPTRASPRLGSRVRIPSPAPIFPNLRHLWTVPDPGASRWRVGTSGQHEHHVAPAPPFRLVA